ncbi:hypothetical protein [Dinoroseobacter sp. S76]|uniref:hypothetical protein n=1 Tax=Dinoroseobacter sp. S76 TaxID=3415124 RepID=UPI003C7EC41D
MSTYSPSTLPPIRWAYSGATDPLIGSGATRAERWLGHGGAALVTALLVWASAQGALPISAPWQWAVLVFFAYDIGGGAAANMLNSCKRFEHTPAKPREGVTIRAVKSAPIFTALHIHPILAAWLLGGSVQAALIWYALLQLAVWLTLATPLYLQRAMATLLTVLAMIAAIDLLPLGPGLEWVIPCLFVKMVMGHAVREEPYAPSPDSAHS